MLINLLIEVGGSLEKQKLRSLVWEDKKKNTALHINSYISRFLSPYSFTSRTHFSSSPYTQNTPSKNVFASHIPALIIEYIVLACGGWGVQQGVLLLNSFKKSA